MNVAEMLAVIAAESPDSVALIDSVSGGTRMTTFAQLDRASSHAAALLRESDIGLGDPVLVFCPMSLELYVNLLALFRVGAVAVFLDPSAGREHIDRCCAMYPLKAMICTPKAHLLRLRSASLRAVPKKFSTAFTVPGATSMRRGTKLKPVASIEPVEDEASALITFTSGSTGQPKMAARSHAFLLAQHRALSQMMGTRPGDADLSTLPIVVLSNLASGASSLIPDVDLRRPDDADPSVVYRQVTAHSPTTTTAAPAFLERLADHCVEHGCKLPSLRKIFCGGAPVFAPLLEKLSEAAPNADVVAVYGSTEAEPIADLVYRDVSPEDRTRMTGGGGLLAGLPVDAIQCRVVRDRWGTPLGSMSGTEFQACTQPPGEPGEIVVSGDHVLSGYVNGVGDKETKFRVDGTVWHRTGDAGYLDENGRLWLLGRCEAVHHDNRGKLYPFAVESAAQLIPGVRRAALLPNRNRRTLVIEPAQNGAHIHTEDLRQALAWAQVDEVRVCGKIPVDKRHNSKIDYGALRDQLADA